MLKLSGIARSTYYYHIKQQDKDKYAGEKADIVEIFDKNKGIYGYRRITEQLKQKRLFHKPQNCIKVNEKP